MSNRISQLYLLCLDLPFLHLLGLYLLCLLCIPCATHAADSQKPNVVIIFVDDLGYGDIGPYGATKQRTPNLDRMAREGMKLTSFYAAPVCSVSRAQLLTGCYGARVSVPGVYPPAAKYGLNPVEQTIAERLKDRGYSTMCIGKWHVGDQPEFLPTRQGFDRYFGIPYSNDMQRTEKEKGKKVVPLMRDEKVAELLTEEMQSKIVKRYTDEAVGFIQESKDRPFLLYLPHTAVHTPIHPGEAFAGKSMNGRFGDWVEEVDWSVGRVLDTLCELKIEEHTLVIFTSDNGPWLIKGSDGGSALPLRGGKGTTWEGGVRVPTVAWWPGKIAPGSVCDAVAGTIDLLPTAVSIAGGTVPAEPVIDGRDLSLLLFGKSKQSVRDAHYYFSGYNLQAVRQGPWKLAITSQPSSIGKGPASDTTETNPRLYNLDVEIGEQTNVAAKHPEIVAKLQALADKMSQEIGGNSPVARRPAGEVTNPVTLYASEDSKPRPNKSKKNGKLTDALRIEAMKPGDALKSENAPQVGGKSFTISCLIETQQQDAILIAHGGLAAGYVVYLKGGKAAFLVRTGSGNAFSEIVAPTAFPTSGRITATLTEDATMTLQVDDQPLVTGRAAKLINRQPQEDFCIGHDNGKPIGLYEGNTFFQGSITDLKVTIP